MSSEAPEPTTADERRGREVGRDEYIALVTSHRRIARLDRACAPIRHIQDIETGECFWIHEADLVGR